MSKDITTVACPACGTKSCTSDEVGCLYSQVATLKAQKADLLEACKAGSSGSLWTHRLLHNASSLLESLGHETMAADLMAKADLEHAAISKAEKL